MFTEEEIKCITKAIVINALSFNAKASLQAVLKSVGRDCPLLRPKMKDPDFKIELRKLINDWNTKSLDELETTLKNLDRTKFQEIIDKKSQDPAKKESSQEISLPDLPGAINGKVVLRLAPYPSGALHIGNARMVILNGYYAKKYNGKLILAFDDTIGSDEKSINPESYDLIPEALEYLDIKVDQIVYKSDRLEIFYEHALKLFDMDKLYVCTCNADIWRNEYRLNEEKTGLPCACRSNNKAINLSLWEKMLNGGFGPGQAVVRMKTGMDQSDPALRDQIALRISDAIHPRVGDKYRVWPLLEYSWGIDDHLLGMTHIIRGRDLYKEGLIEKFIWDWFGWQHPEIILHGRVKTEGFTFSKSRDARNIQEGIYSGWDDPRTWSLQSLQRRGFLAKTIWNTILALGIGENTVRITPSNLYYANRELVDDLTPRVFAIENPTKLIVNNLPDTFIGKVKIENHPTNKKLGNHNMDLSSLIKNNTLQLFIEKDDAKILKNVKHTRLMHLFNIQYSKLTKGIVYANYNGDDHTFIYENKFPFIQWIAQNYITVPLILENGSTTTLKVEPYIRNFKKRDLIQLIRKSFVAIDSTEPNLRIIFSHK